MTSPVVYLNDLQKRSPFLAMWERRRNSKPVHWAIECFAEMTGVFLYTYFGLGSTAGFVIGNIIKQTGLSSVFQIGLGYGFGIVFALAVCASTSGGHFNPCITTVFVLFKGFPPLKAVRYIVAQILGAFIAAALVYNQWKPLIEEAELLLMSAGAAKFNAIQFTPNGPPGIFALYLLPGQTLSRVFLNEFVNVTILTLIIFAAVDPTNNFITPVSAPWAIGLAYATAIWGFGVPGISLNAARDVGARLFAIAIWGTPAAGGAYAAIAALTNIPATIFAAFLYEFFFVDSDKVVNKAHLEFLQNTANHRRLQKSGEGHNGAASLNHSQISEEKGMYEHKEHGTAV